MEGQTIRKVTEALLIDAERYGGTLSLEQVERVLDRRRLAPSECVEVFRALVAQGVISSGEDDSDLPIIGVPAAAEQDEDETEPAQDEFEFQEKEEIRDEFPAAAFEIDVQAAKLTDIGSHQLLTAQEEKELGRAIRIAQTFEIGLEQGDIPKSPEVISVLKRGEQARTKLTLLNLRLVMKSAYRYSAITDLEFDDLFQEGVIGLLRAIEKYDHTLGYKFSTYATWWIVQKITRYIADCGATIRLPVHMHEKVLKLRRAIRVLTRFTGKTPTIGQLAEEIDSEPEYVQFLLDISNQVMVELHRPLSEDSQQTIGDLLPSPDSDPEADVCDLDARRTILEILSSLTPREKVIIIKRFGLDYKKEFTLQELGDEFSLTRERIRQIEAIALRKLRHPTRSRVLAEILDETAQEEEDEIDQ